MSKWFVSTQWLADHLSDPDVLVVDASWHMPQTGRDPRAEFLAGHIPGAVFFDIDAIADHDTDLPHMLPTPDAFAKAAGALGLSADKTIIVYDETGFMSAPRVWWTLTIMGAHGVRVLDGGGPKWRAEGRPLAVGPAAPKPATFDVTFHPERVVGRETVAAHSRARSIQIADARSFGRFTGEEPEPRPGLRSGHIPGSVSTPIGTLHRNGLIKSADELRAQFEATGLDLTKPIITSCGSGITACAVSLALQVAGARDVAVYDGSWTEWGGRPDTEIATGSA